MTMTTHLNLPMRPLLLLDDDDDTFKSADAASFAA
jgi:hypothetical protein